MSEMVASSWKDLLWEWKEWCLNQSAWAPIPKHHRVGGLNNRHFFLRVLEAQSPPARCWRIQCLVRVLFQAWQLPSHRVLTWPSSVCSEREQLSSLPGLKKTWAFGAYSPTRTTSFKLNCLPKDLLSKASHSGILMGHNSVYHCVWTTLTILNRAWPEGGSWN